MEVGAQRLDHRRLFSDQLVYQKREPLLRYFQNHDLLAGAITAGGALGLPFAEAGAGREKLSQSQ